MKKNPLLHLKKEKLSLCSMITLVIIYQFLMDPKSDLTGVEGTTLGTLFHLGVLIYFLDFSSYNIYLANIPFSPCYKNIDYHDGYRICMLIC